MIFTSNVHGRLKVKGVILFFGDKIDLSSDEVENNTEIRNLVVTKQLLQNFDNA